MATISIDPRELDETSGVLDVLVVGGGFAGLYQLDQLRSRGFSVKVVEAGDSLGGIWYWNCYPGARTDSTGQIYQYSREDLWKDWSYDELYPSWSGVRDYFAYVDRKLDLSRDIIFSTRVTSADFDGERNQWTVRTSTGRMLRARSVVICTGFGAKPYIPSIKGLNSFAGESHHTALWPQEGLDMAGKRVGIIGTGSSGVQVTQEAAADAEQITIFQRTPNLALPMRQQQLTGQLKEKLKENLPERFAQRRRSFAGFDMDFIPKSVFEVSDEERADTYERMWATGGFELWLANYQDILLDERANRTMYDFWRNKVHQRVTDPVKAEKLAPMDPPHPFGTKRPSLEQNFYDVVNQENVDIVDVNEDPIERITPAGVQTKSGLREFDILVFATGFDANRGGITSIDIRGTNDQLLSHKWSERLDTFMGLTTAGFPNLMFVYGPQSPAGFCNGPTCAEVQGEIVVDFLTHVRDGGYQRFETSEDAEQSWTAHVEEVFHMSLFPRAKSWYHGANIPGKPSQMLNYSGGLPSYFDHWEENVAAGYKAFTLS